MLLVALAIGAIAFRHGGSASNVRNRTPAVAGLPPPIRPAFVPGRPRLLPEAPAPARWAPVLARTEARTLPSAGASAVGALETTTPEGTTNIVLVFGTREDRRGRVWSQVSLPVLPNGTTGWVPRSVLGGYVLVRERLVVDLERLQLVLLRDGKPVFRAPVGVGRFETPTPSGRFYIRDRLTRYRSPFYGPLAFGTSARSATLTDWPAGGFIGIHGTNEPGLLPGRVSHGCIRLRNEDILELARLMPVGTPITIR